MKTSSNPQDLRELYSISRGEGSVSAWVKWMPLPKWHPENAPGLLNADTHTQTMKQLTTILRSFSAWALFECDDNNNQREKTYDNR